MRNRHRKRGAVRPLNCASVRGGGEYPCGGGSPLNIARAHVELILETIAQERCRSPSARADSRLQP